MSKNPENIIGREPNSSVVFHALPRHDKDLIIDEEKPLSKEDKWQDDEHLVYNPALKDPKGVVGHLEKDWEQQQKQQKQQQQRQKSSLNNNNINNTFIGREPNSSVIFHALPRHDKDLPLDEMMEDGKSLSKKDNL